MEIKYDALNALKIKRDEIEQYKPKSMYLGAYNCFRMQVEDMLDESDKDEILQSERALGSFLNDNDFYGLSDEISFNLANIPSNELCVRYLTFVCKELETLTHLLEDRLDYDYWAEVEDRIRSVDHWHEPKKAYKDFVFALIREKGAPYTMTDEEYSTKLRLQEAAINAGDSVVHKLLRTYLSIIDNSKEVHQEVLSFIDELTNATQEPVSDHELTANTHRLLLFHRLGLFEPLFDKYHQHLGAVRFCKLISTILGVQNHEGFRPSINDLIKELSSNKVKPTIQTKGAINSVNAFLADIGLTV